MHPYSLSFLLVICILALFELREYLPYHFCLLHFTASKHGSCKKKNQFLRTIQVTSKERQFVFCFAPQAQYQIVSVLSFYILVVARKCETHVCVYWGRHQKAIEKMRLMTMDERLNKKKKKTRTIRQVLAQGSFFSTMKRQLQLSSTCMKRKDYWLLKLRKFYILLVVHIWFTCFDNECIIVNANGDS